MIKMKRYNIISIIMCAVLCGSCSEDDIFGNGSLSTEQKALIGRAVNFNASMAEEFNETRVSYNHEGGFNEGDLMMIYRQYWDSNEGKWEDTQAFRTYHYAVTYAPGTTINLSTDWKVFEGRMKCDNWDGTTGDLEVQDKSDSLTWETGATVRFRAWSRSNVAGCLSNGSAGSYYPDFCVADWVTVSGPTQGIPLSFRHLCSRLRLSYFPGNQFYGADICLNKADYQWQDNADSHENDLKDILSDDDAQKVVDEVKAVFNKMCLPAGVNIENGTLRAMTNTLYDNLKAANSGKGEFHLIEQKTDGIVNFGDMSASEIATNVKHPSFSNVDGQLYLITIPYDMSKDPETQGEVLTLPAHTRFRVRLRDVNNGDHNLSTEGYEYKEHIFSLYDIKSSEKDADGNYLPKFPDGLKMSPGKSYRFQVGYLYDQLKVTVIEEGIDWSTMPEQSGNATDQGVAENNPTPYSWYQEAINAAIRDTKQSYDYNPIFRISTAEQFKEFIALVNGTAAKKMSGLERAPRAIDNPDATSDLDDKTSKRYWWYDVEKTRESLATEFGDTVWVTRAEAELQGYVFYRHYNPQISDQAARSYEDYVRGPVSFYDEQVTLHLVVQLANDIDLHDWQMESIGSSADHPFKGYFDGGTHLLSNVNMKDQYLFGNVEDAEIRDLRLSSTHNLALLDSGTTSGVTHNLRIVGISIKADCTVSPIAQTLSGTGITYVVGCIHEGDAGGALVGTASNMTMYGCMQASSNITGAALLGNYADGVAPYLEPQGEKVTLKWSRFMCNFYQKSPDQITTAIGSAANTYRPQEYIRGARQHILRAKHDNMIADDTPYEKLTDMQKEEFYGLAPWKAMTYAIFQYNQTTPAMVSEYQYNKESHQCHMHYTVDNIGYAHLYPQLLPCPNDGDGNPGLPTNEGVKNILYLNN